MNNSRNVVLLDTSQCADFRSISVSLRSMRPKKLKTYHRDTSKTQVKSSEYGLADDTMASEHVVTKYFVRPQ